VAWHNSVSIKANGDTSDMPSAFERVAGKESDWIESPSHMKPYVSQLKAYLAGELKQFDFALDLRGTDFQKNVGAPCLRSLWRDVQLRDIADAVGSKDAFRAVGKPTTAILWAVVVPLPSRDHHCRHARRIWWRTRRETLAAQTRRA